MSDNHPNGSDVATVTLWGRDGRPHEWIRADAESVVDVRWHR